MMGKVVFILSYIVTAGIYLLSKQLDPARDYLQMGVQLFGLLGILSLSWSFLLAIRHEVLERWFGGLDTAYKYHHLAGGLSTVLLLQHVALLVIRGLPQNLLGLYLVPGLRLDYSLGQIALYVMVGLIALTFYIPLPYRMWKWSHEWMGIVIILGGLHSFLVDSDVSRNPLVFFWILIWTVAAILAFLYKRFGYFIWQKSAKYKVVQKNIVNELLILDLQSDTPILFDAGQYGFFSMIGGPRDEHAFSILAQSDSGIRIGIKILKNFTKVLASLEVGEQIVVRGPYGTFAGKMEQAKHMVFVAGGIGITPFAMMLDKIAAAQKVEMYFCAKVMPSPVLTQPFIDYMANHPNFAWLPCETSKLGRITAEQIFARSNRDLNAYYFLCGPSEMMEEIAMDLQGMKIKRSHIIYEDFGFK